MLGAASSPALLHVAAKELSDHLCLLSAHSFSGGGAGVVVVVSAQLEAKQQMLERDLYNRRRRHRSCPEGGKIIKPKVITE